MSLLIAILSSEQKKSMAFCGCSVISRSSLNCGSWRQISLRLECPLVRLQAVKQPPFILWQGPCGCYISWNRNICPRLYTIRQTRHLHSFNHPSNSWSHCRPSCLPACQVEIKMQDEMNRPVKKPLTPRVIISFASHWNPFPSQSVLPDYEVAIKGLCADRWVSCFTRLLGI